jgi:hypothetical protein
LEIPLQKDDVQQFSPLGDISTGMAQQFRDLPPPNRRIIQPGGMPQLPLQFLP